MAIFGDDVVDDNWMLDSGASSHMTPEVHNLFDLPEYSSTNLITIENDLGLPISHIGSTSKLMMALLH